MTPRRPFDRDALNHPPSQEFIDHIDAQANCRTCDAPVIWAEHVESGKRMPLNRDPIDGGPYQIDENGKCRVDRSFPTGRISHFATCPQAKTWRKK